MPRATLANWRTTHGAVHDADAAGNTNGAVSYVITAGPGGKPSTNSLAGGSAPISAKHSTWCGFGPTTRSTVRGRRWPAPRWALPR